MQDVRRVCELEEAGMDLCKKNAANSSTFVGIWSKYWKWIFNNYSQRSVITVFLHKPRGALETVGEGRTRTA